MSEAAHALPPHLRGLLARDAYAERPARVEFRQTHISWVFLVGDFVYKVKKPLRLSFLDYSTIELRLHFCSEEVRLNRRLAPRVYLGVAPIVIRDGGCAVGAVDRAPDGEVVDYAVCMHRLPEERMLDRVLQRQGADAVPLDALTERLASFHAGCSIGEAKRHGTPEAIRQLMLENLHETDRFVGATLRAADRYRLECAALAFVDARRGLLERRLRDGFVREGHGDLRPEHVCLAPEGVVVFDCVEFSARFRTADVASEIAFLTMELEFLGFPELAEDLAAAYARRTADAEFESLLRFYGVHRAIVRGKVESLKSAEPEVPQGERETARDAAARYFRLAARYAVAPRPPELIAVLGLSGTGKSTVARVVAELTGFPVYSSDVLRKRIAEREGVTAKERLYDADWNRRTYQALRERAERRLASRRGAIVDATFQNRSERRWLADLAGHAGVTLVILECRADDGEVRSRLEARAARPDSISDATWSVHLRQRTRFTPVVAPRGARHAVIDTTHGVDVDALERVLAG